MFDQKLLSWSVTNPKQTRGSTAFTSFVSPFVLLNVCNDRDKFHSCSTFSVAIDEHNEGNCN